MVFTWYFIFIFSKKFPFFSWFLNLTPDRDITWAPGANLTPLIKPLLMVEAMLGLACQQVRRQVLFFAFTWCRSKKVFSTQSMYKDIMKEECTPHRCINWKVKLPLKIKVFLWYFNQRVILTKDNLVKRKWKGMRNANFFYSKESIRHLFFDWRMARLVWGAVDITFGFRPPTIMSSLFGPWLKSFRFKFRNKVLISVAAGCWAL
jgi:hypothetical protein